MAVTCAREVTALWKLKSHPNVVELIGYHYSESWDESQRIFTIYMERCALDLREVIGFVFSVPSSF